MSWWASCAAGAAVLLLAGAHAAGATADRSSTRLPAQVWGVSLGQPAAAGVLAAARRAGVNALILDSATLGAGARASLRRGAGAAGLQVYEPAYVGRAGSGASQRAGRETCRRAHRATQPCLLFAPDVQALGALARVAGVDALVLRLRTPGLLARLQLPLRVRVIALVDLRDATSAGWSAAIRAAAASVRLDLAAAPAGAHWQAALGSFLVVLAEHGGTPPEPAPAPAPAPVPAPAPAPAPPGGGGGGGSGGSGGGGGGGGTTDATAPTAPTSLQAAATAQTSVSLTWTASTDNVAVTGYTVLSGGAASGTTAATAFTVSGLTGCTSYTFTVTAQDAAGNTSPASNPLTVTTTGCSVGASVFVAAGGSDGNTCTTSASPCQTFQAAFNIVAAGGSVEVADGTYPAQSVAGDRGGLVTFRPATGATVTMNGTLSLDGVQHLKLIDFHFPRVDPNYDLLLRPCNSDVTLQNSVGRRFFILEGNSNITFSGGSWGGYATPDDEDSGIGTSNGGGAADPTGLASCGGATAGPAHNIRFDGVTFHDVFWNTACTDPAAVCTQSFGITCTSAIGTCSDGWATSHPDCLELNGYVDGVTIENSTFAHCGNTMLSLYTDQGNIDNVVVRNNTFRDMAPTSYFGMQWTDTHAFTCSGDRFLNNTYTPNAPGAWLANTPPRFECDLASGGTPTEVAGNTFQEAPQSQDCTRSKTQDATSYLPDVHVYNTNWHDNVYSNAITVDETACSSP